MKKRNYGIVVLVLMVFFVISFLTNVMGPLIPLIKESYQVGLAMASLLPVFFFIAYGVMSIPAGILVEKYKEKRMMVFSFALASFGALLFAAFPKYEVSLLSLFLMGAGMAILQVAINPLLRESGGEENFAFFSVLAQLFFGGASFISPWVSTNLVESLANFSPTTSPFYVKWLALVVPENLPWTAIYWVIAVVALLMVVVISFTRMPKVELKDDEKVGGWQTTLELFKNKTVVLFFVGIFAYVGTEQGLANWMSQFLKEYHGLDPLVVISLTHMPKVELKDDEKVGGWQTTLELFKNKTVVLFFIGIFAYVGTEQGLANWMSQFLKEYHGLDPLVEGKNAVSLFWGMLTVGCFLGLVLLKFIDSKLVLKLFSIGAVLSLVFALFGSAQVAQYAFAFSGFSLSVMWSIVFSLALNSLEKHHGTFAGILCTGIAGGAIVSFIVGLLGDMFGLKVGMLFLFITIGYILSIGFWANPLVNNETIKLGKKKKR